MTYELPMIDFNEKNEFLFFHKFNNIEKISDSTTLFKNSFLHRKINAFKLMDLYIPKYFKKLIKGKNIFKIFK